MVSISAEASSSKLPLTRPSKPSLKGKERAIPPPSTSTSKAADPSAGIERKKRKLRSKYPDASPSVIDEKAARWWDRQEKAKAGRKDKAAAMGLPEDEIDSADEAAGHQQAYVPWEWSAVAEKVNNIQSPVWTRDGRFHFVASGKQILIHESGPPDYTLISTLPATVSSTDGHSGAITSFHLHPSNPLELITASEDGTVKVWSWTDSRLIRTLDVASALLNTKSKGAAADEESPKERVKVDRMAVGVEGGKAFGYLAIDAATRDYQILTKLVRIPLRIPQTTNAAGQSAAGVLSKHIFRLGQINSTVNDIQVSPHATYLSMTTPDGLYVRKLGVKPSHEAWLRITTDVTVTCLRWCPNEQGGTMSLVRKTDEEWFATGDKGGAVRLYRGGLAHAFKSAQHQQTPGVKPDAWFKIGSSSPNASLVSTALHWHSHPVHALCFTPYGGQLLSGGEENVLVTWHLDTLKNSFMARLSVGATGFEWIGVKPMGLGEGTEEEYWSGFADGSVVKVGAATSRALPVGKRARINKLDKDLQLGKRYPLAFHAPTRSIVLNSSHPSTLQFFRPSTSSLVFDLEVIPSNRVSRADKEITPIKVSSVVLSPATAHSEAGQWMATYESRVSDQEQGGGKVTAVKLWYWGSKNGYVLNTQLDRVHGFDNVTSMSFAPAQILGAGGSADSRRGAGWLFLTTGSDGTAKVWTVRRGFADGIAKGSGKKAPVQEEAFWALRSSFQYRPGPITAASFSPDGTLIVLAQDSLLTLWSTSTNALVRTLESADVKTIAQTLFLGTSGRYLVIRGDRERGGGLVLWDLLSCGPVWTREQGRFSACLPGNNEEQFVTLDAGKSVTRVEVFSVHSPGSISRHVVPFGIVQATVTPAANDRDETVEYTGLARDGTVVRFGAHVEPFERTLTDDATEKRTTDSGVKNQSIWEEMFGKDTFVDVVTPHQSAASALENDGDDPAHSTSKTLSKRGKYSDVYDAPNSSLPPSSLLFDAFVRDFMALSHRPSNTEDRADAPTDDHKKVTISAALSGSTPAGAGVRDVQRSTESRMVGEREVKGWFTGFIGPKAKAAQAAQRAASQSGGTMGTPAPTPNHLGKGAVGAGTPGTPTPGSAGKKSGRKVSGKQTAGSNGGTPSRTGRSNGTAVVGDDAEVMVGSKRKKAGE